MTNPADTKDTPAARFYRAANERTKYLWTQLRDPSKTDAECRALVAQAATEIELLVEELRATRDAWLAEAEGK